MWELDYKESWARTSWCFWTVVLEKSLEVLWIAKRSNKSILKEISTEYSLERLMLKLKLECGHLMWRTDSLGKTLMPRKIESRKRRIGQTIRWWDGGSDFMDMSLRNWWWTGKSGILQSMESQELDTIEWPNWTKLKTSTKYSVLP